MAIWVVLLALISYAGGLVTGWVLLQHLGYALGLVVAFSFLFAFVSRRGLSASISTDRLSVLANEELEETVVLRKDGILPALWTWIDAGSNHRSFLGVLGGEERSWRRTRVFPYRGAYSIGGDVIRVGDPFGLFALRACSVNEIDVIVHPRPIPVPRETLRPALEDIRKPRWSAEDATLGDLRHYVAGDPPSRIHWRSTARTGSLIVAPPETHARKAVWLAVDLGGGEEAADRTAGIAAYLVQELMATGCDVAAVVAGQKLVVVPPQRAAEGAGRVLTALARVEASEESAIPSIVSAISRADRPTTVVALTPQRERAGDLHALRRRVGRLTLISSQSREEDEQ